jgi:membrane-bound metal-dependent hydrolase YbcI (DUF457 family)
MNRLTHFSTGLLTGILLYNNGTTTDASAQVLALAVGSYFPDIDISWGFGDESEGAKHRGFTHTVVFATIVYVLCWIANLFLHRYTDGLFETGVMQALVLPFCLGILLHIFVDSMTPAGVQPFLPFSTLHLWLFASPKKARVNRKTLPNGTPYTYKTNRGIPSDSAIVNLTLSLLCFYLAYICDVNKYSIYNANEWLPVFASSIGSTIKNGFNSVWRYITTLIK